MVLRINSKEKEIRPAIRRLCRLLGKSRLAVDSFPPGMDRELLSFEVRRISLEGCS